MIRRASLIEPLLGELIEIVCTLDRALLLHEAGLATRVFRSFVAHASDRNLAIFAQPAASTHDTTSAQPAASIHEPPSAMVMAGVCAEAGAEAAAGTCAELAEVAPSAGVEVVEEASAWRELSSVAARWREVTLDAAARRRTLTQAVVEGRSVIVVPSFASDAECACLLEAAQAKAAAVRASRASSQQPGKLSTSLALRLEHSSAPMVTPGRVRMPVDCLGPSACRTCDELLLRAIEWVETEVPSLAAELFGVAALHKSLSTSLSTSLSASLRTDGRLVFTHNEPAVNVYRSAS